MNEAHRRAECLRDECRVYARYLTGLPPTDYVVRKYLLWHEAAPSSVTRESGPFDELLVRLSRWGIWWTRLGDTYASRFYKDALLRKKLVLVLALLECSPACFEHVDGAPSGGPWRACFHLAHAAALHAMMLVLAAGLLSPARLFLQVAGLKRLPEPR